MSAAGGRGSRPGRALALALAVAGGLLGCGPTALPSLHDAALRAQPGPAEAERVRALYTRYAASDALEFRWLEATWIDPEWLKAEAEDWARRTEGGPEAAAQRLEERSRELAGSGDLGFELWVFTHCEGCEDLGRWSWVLIGPGPEPRPLLPSSLRWEVVQEEPQTLRMLGIERRVTLRKVRAVLRFAAAPQPGPWVLHGVPGRDYDSFSFEWTLPR